MAGYGWFEGKVLYFSTQNITFCLLSELQTVEAADFDGIDLILW